LLGRIFPKQFDNNYRGYKLAIVLLVPIALLRLIGSVSAMGGNPWVSNRFMIEVGDGIPLDSFGADAAGTVVLLFAISFLHYLMLGLLSVVVLIRYRAMIPFVFLLMLIDEIVRKALVLLNPIGVTGAPSGADVNIVFLAAFLIGLALSLGKTDPVNA
jgi:hypothetical protein